jgi:hypothetical protein
VLGVNDLIGPGLDDFLAWAGARGEPVPARCAEVTLALLVLRGASVRGGLPQPAVKLLGQVLRDDLPQLVCGGPEEVAAYPRVLRLLIDRQRAAGLLNAERHRALQAAVRKAVPDYERDVRNPRWLTWPRLYGGLLRADGVEVTDQQAVRDWLADYRSRSGRRPALASAFDAPNGAAGGRGEEGWVERAVRLRMRAAIVDLRTSRAELHLCSQLHRWVKDQLRAALRALQAAERGRPLAGGPALDGDMGAAVPAVGDEETAADFLVDRTTGAGLSAALRGDFSELAAGAGSPADGSLVDELSRRREQGTELESLPAVEDVSAERFAELVRGSALLAAAVELAEWVAQRGGLPCPPALDATPVGDDLELVAAWAAELPAQTAPEVWRVALAVGLLRVFDGQVVAGGAVQVWRDGSAAELLELALDALDALVAELGLLADRACAAGVAAKDCEILAALAADLPDMLFQLYSTAQPESLARYVAVFRDWMLPWQAEDADPEDCAAPASSLDARLRRPRPRVTHLDAAQLAAASETDTQANTSGMDQDGSVEYRLPPDHELHRLLGLDNISDHGKAQLLELAYWQALLLDRLDALGVLRRNADRVELTMLGRTLLRAVLLQAGFEVPTDSDLAASDADTLLRAMPSWPSRAGLSALRTWLQAREDTDTGWTELLQAAAAGPRNHRLELFALLGVRSPLDPADHQAEPPRLPAPLERPEAERSLVAALHEAVPDPVIGAYAAQALRLREIVPAEPSRPADAVLLLDRFVFLGFADYWPGRHEDEDDGTGTGTGTGQQRQPHGIALCAAFDAAAAGWPGGPGDLLRQLAAASQPIDAHIFDLLGQAHPAPLVAAAARAARDRIGRGQRQTTPDRGTGAQPAAGSDHRQRPANRPARTRKRKRHR